MWHHKTLRREHRQKFLWHKSYQCFLRSVFPPDQSNRNKNKNKQMGPNQTYMLLHSKGNQKQNEKTTNRMGENNCKWCDQRRVNFQNIHIAHTTKQRKTNNPIEKWAEDLFRQRRNTDGQQQCEKMLSTANYREMQIKTTIRYHLMPVRMAITEESTNNKCWSICGEKGTLLHC